MLQTVKTQYFSDFEGSVKSLGAWGGDFALAASDMNESQISAYFSSKGFNTVISYRDMIYSPANVDAIVAGK